MSWKTQNSVKRLYSFLKRNKAKAYPEDISALKIVMDELELIKTQQAIDNILFTKLLSVHLRFMILSDRSIKGALMETQKHLSMPLDLNIEILRKRLNEKKITEYLKSIDVVDGIEKDGEWIYRKDGANNAKISEHQQEIVNILLNEWTFENVESSIYNSANEFIRDINNYAITSPEIK